MFVFTFIAASICVSIFASTSVYASVCIYIFKYRDLYQYLYASVSLFAFSTVCTHSYFVLANRPFAKCPCPAHLSPYPLDPVGVYAKLKLGTLGLACPPAFLPLACLPDCHLPCPGLGLCLLPPSHVFQKNEQGRH